MIAHQAISYSICSPSSELGPTFDTNLIQELFLQQLLRNVQMILATTSTLSLPDLTVHADCIMDITTQPVCPD